MSEFKNKSITTKGMELLAKALGGETLQFTHIEMGSGTYTGDIGEATSLIEKKQYLPITKITRKGGQVTLSATLKLEDIKEAFNWSEIGVYAKGNDERDTLYMYGYTENTSYISKDSLNEKLIHVTVMVSSASEVTAVIDNSLVYLTLEELKSHNMDIKAHEDIRKNIELIKETISNIDVSWEGITGKPVTFPPASHQHDERYYTTAQVQEILSDRGLLTSCKTISNCNDIVSNGLYMGSGVTNAPDDNWYMFENIVHNDSWIYQRAIGFTQGTSTQYERMKMDGVWTTWVRIGVGNMIKATNTVRKVINMSGVDVSNKSQNQPTIKKILQPLTTLVEKTSGSFRLVIELTWEGSLYYVGSNPWQEWVACNGQVILSSQMRQEYPAGGYPNNQQSVVDLPKGAIIPSNAPYYTSDLSGMMGLTANILIDLPGGSGSVVPFKETATFVADYPLFNEPAQIILYPFINADNNARYDSVTVSGTIKVCYDEV